MVEMSEKEREKILKNFPQIFSTYSGLMYSETKDHTDQRSWDETDLFLPHKKIPLKTDNKIFYLDKFCKQKEEDKELSIPEAELMAAYLGVLVATIIITALEPLGVKLQVYLWSDSQIVHHWISKEEGHPRQFITNRVKKIRDFNKIQAATWKYVPSADNPADILSRGASFQELQASKL